MKGQDLSERLIVGATKGVRGSPLLDGPYAVRHIYNQSCGQPHLACELRKGGRRPKSRRLHAQDSNHPERTSRNRLRAETSGALGYRLRRSDFRPHTGSGRTCSHLWARRPNLPKNARQTLQMPAARILPLSLGHARGLPAFSPIFHFAPCLFTFDFCALFCGGDSG